MTPLTNIPLRRYILRYRDNAREPDMFGSKGRWYKGNLHMHSVLSDGKLEPDEVRQMYKDAGYDFAALTDHWSLSENLPANDGFLELSGVEYDTGDMINGKVFHILGIGMDRPAFDETRHDIPVEKIVSGIRECGGIAILAHPAWSVMNPDDISRLDGIAGAEIYNTVSDPNNYNCRRADASLYFDLWADKGYMIPAFAADDSHWYTGEQLQSYIMVKAEALTKDAIFDAIAKGHFYASQGPEFTSITRKDNKVIVRFGGADKILFVSNSVFNINRVQDGSLGIAVYEFTATDKYVRIELISEDGKLAWSSPIKK